MAGELWMEGGGGGFWLPPELLGAGEDDFLVPRGASPNDSSDEEQEDEYLAGLTREMAHFFLLDDDDDAAAAAVAAGRNAKVRDVSGTSPQSTLCAMNYLLASGRETPWDAPPKAAPAVGAGKEEGAWRLLYEAADQVMRMRLQKQAPPQPPAPPPAPASKGRFAGEDQAATRRRQLQAAQFHALRRQQLLKQQQQQQMAAMWQKQARARAGAAAGRAPAQSPAAWPPLQKPQQQPARTPAAGMRAVFLTGAKESAGTGVFLPRRPDVPAESRKKPKPACSTVLLPARVVQALNLNLDELGANPCVPGGFVLDHDALARRSMATAPQTKRGGRNLRAHTPPGAVPAAAAAAAAASPELRLPQEWTY